MLNNQIKTVPQIRNTNFISSRMDVKDIELCFIFDGKTRPFINSLVEEGYLQKTGDRYYKPTDRLLSLAFLPEKIILTTEQRRYVTRNSAFTAEQLRVVFNNQMIKWLMVNNWIYVDANQRYRKSDQFNNWLVDGEDTINFK